AINDFPQSYFFAGAFYNLDQWVRKGVPPPKAGFVESANDEFGNVRGGIRSPWLDVPGGTFYPAMKGPANCADIGYWVPFSWQRLEAIYGSYENYQKKFLAAVDRVVKERWVTPSDAEKIRAGVAKGSPYSSKPSFCVYWPLQWRRQPMLVIATHRPRSAGRCLPKTTIE